jgi:hypothetical protein
MPRPRQAPVPARASNRQLAVDPLVEAARIPVWRPLPFPTLMRDAPAPEDQYDSFASGNEPLISRRMSWAGMMTWCWGVVVLLLVVSPLAAVSKLAGPFSQPISAAGYGILIAPFAFIAVVVAGGAGLWLWLAMGHEYAPPEDDPLTGLL